MAHIRRTYIGENPDGSPHYKYDPTGDPGVDTGDTVLTITGPIAGTLTLPNGSTYEVTPHFIEVAAADLDLFHATVVQKHLENQTFGPDWRPADGEPTEIVNPLDLDAQAQPPVA